MYSSMQKLSYFGDMINLLEWSLYVTSLLFVVPFLFEMNTVWQWQCGAAAAFLAWFNFLLILQRYGLTHTVGWSNVGPTSGRQYRRWANVGPTYIVVWELSNLCSPWRHEMEQLSALMVLCEGSPSVTDGFPCGPVTASRYFLWGWPEQAVERTAKIPTIWDAMTNELTS